MGYNVKTHGHTKWNNGRPKRTPTYGTWAHMLNRCHGNPEKWPTTHYVERGITVCERWRTFDNFLADLGERPEGTTLERIDNAKGYFPGNCRWATRKAQANNRSTNVLFEFRGVMYTMAQLALMAGLSKHTIRHRLVLAKPPWPIEEAMSTAPSHGNKYRHHVSR